MKIYGKFIDYKKTGKADKSSTSNEAIKKYNLEHSIHTRRNYRNNFNLFFFRSWSIIKLFISKMKKRGTR